MFNKLWISAHVVYRFSEGFRKVQKADWEKVELCLSETDLMLPYQGKKWNCSDTVLMVIRSNKRALHS